MNLLYEISIFNELKSDSYIFHILDVLRGCALANFIGSVDSKKLKQVENILQIYEETRSEVFKEKLQPDEFIKKVREQTLTRMRERKNGYCCI
jgi:hypothetical protein